MAEAVVDGGAWVASKVVGVFNEDAEKAMKEFIAVDWVSEGNKALYGEGGLLEGVNDVSALKYDSEVAQGIRSATEKVGAVVAATALTVVTGGAGAAVVGGIYGAGKAAENTYQKSTDTSTLQELMILGSGALNAVSWYSSGALGAGLLNVASSAAEVGGKEAAETLLKFAFSKQNIREVFSLGNSGMNLLSSIMQSGGEIADIFVKIMNDEEVSVDDYIKLAVEIFVYFGVNTLDDLLKGGIKTHDNVLKSGQDIEEALRVANLSKKDYNELIKKGTTLNEISNIKNETGNIEISEEYDVKSDALDTNKIEVLDETDLKHQIKNDGLEAYEAKGKLNHSTLPNNIRYKMSDRERRSMNTHLSHRNIKKALSNEFGVKDSEIVNKTYEALVGDLYKDTGIAAGNWDEFIEMVKPYLKDSIQSKINETGNPILWSKIEENFQEIMNEKYTTANNSTLGEIFQVVNRHCKNWNSTGIPGPKQEDFWSKLSEVYAEACSEVIDPRTGKNLDTINFLFPNSYSVDNCFGNIFKKAELPTILAKGNISTITMSKVDQKTMEIIETIDVDISDISKYYQEMDIGLGAKDVDLTSKVFDMFVNKIKEAI